MARVIAARDYSRTKHGIRPTPGADPDFDYRWRMCFSKIHYDSEVKANAAAKRFKKRFKDLLRAYRCPIHEPAHWHLTKRDQL